MLDVARVDQRVVQGVSAVDSHPSSQTRMQEDDGDGEAFRVFGVLVNNFLEVSFCLIKLMYSV